MTVEELLQYFQTFACHSTTCSKNPAKLPRILLLREKIVCTCGLDKVLTELGLPIPKVREEKADELETLAKIPPCVRKRESCALCGTINPIEMYEKDKRGVIARYKCLCGHEYALIHEGRAAAIFDQWREKEKEKCSDAKSVTSV